MYNNSNSHSLVVRMQNGSASFEDSWLGSQETKHTLTIKASKGAAWYLPQRVENLCLHQTLHTVVYSSFNCQKLEATNMSFSGWMDEYIVVLADNGRLLSAKKK